MRFYLWHGQATKAKTLSEPAQTRAVPAIMYMY